MVYVLIKVYIILIYNANNLYFSFLNWVLDNLKKETQFAYAFDFEQYYYLI